MTLGIWLVRTEAERLGLALQQHLGGEVFRPWQNTAVSHKNQFHTLFSQHSHWVMIMATGIAVRFIDGLVQDKHTDPAVVVVDEAARYAIALLGGHEAGANRLAYQIARAINATPIITTATEALKPLVIGIGCRKGVSAEQIGRAFSNALPGQALTSVREVATIDLKAHEPGLLEFCARHNLPLRIFTHEQIAARPWVTEASSWVREKIGVDGVCEPCALLASTRGRLIVPKTACDGVTVAAVEDNLELML